MKKTRHRRNDETIACCLHFVELKHEKSTHDVTANLPKIYQINLKKSLLLNLTSDFTGESKTEELLKRLELMEWLGWDSGMFLTRPRGKSLLDVSVLESRGPQRRQIGSDWNDYNFNGSEDKLQRWWVWWDVTLTLFFGSKFISAHNTWMWKGVRNDMIIWYDMIWHAMTCYDMIWCDMTWYDMIWYDVTWCDSTWCDVIFHVFLRRWSHPKKRRSLEAF